MSNKKLKLIAYRLGWTGGYNVFDNKNNFIEHLNYLPVKWQLKYILITTKKEG